VMHRVMVSNWTNEGPAAAAQQPIN
jgi:hypothetical protein